MREQIVRAEDPKVEVGGFGAFYRHGWHSWSPTGWVEPGLDVTPLPDEGRRLGHDDPSIAFATTVSSSDVGAALRTDGTVTLLGALAPDARVRPDGTMLVGTCEAGPIDWLVAEGRTLEVFAAYARHLAGHLGTRPRKRPRVWCSWYSSYEDITEAGMRRDLAGIGDLPFDVVQIDDGWERSIGDWTPNHDFPSGMPAMADAIRSTGRRAGLWLAPYIARSDSQLVDERPELLLRNADGSPVVSGINWGGPYYSLDPTSEATGAFVHDLISTVRAWGFDYLKLDFLYAAAYPGVHARPQAREAAYRRGLELIREAAGDDCYLNACGAPVIASLGVVDAIRIGPDVAEFWEEPDLTAMGDYSGRGARNAIITTSERLWLRDVVDADPDVMYVDRDATELDEATRMALWDLARITGFVGTSDHVGDLDPGERRSLASLLRDSPTVAQHGWHRWTIDDRPVDFRWAHRPPIRAPGRDT